VAETLEESPESGTGRAHLGFDDQAGIKRRNPGFNERAYGPLFNDLLLEAQKRVW